VESILMRLFDEESLSLFTPMATTKSDGERALRRGQTRTAYRLC
jgi:hypothetical protein